MSEAAAGMCCAATCRSPVAVLKESALAHNLRWMADFTRDAGVLIAPHGKTTMAPQLFARQLEAGAWGITFATMQQVSLGVAAGIRRIILANQLIGREDIAQARALLTDSGPRASRSRRLARRR
jgi:D-serine dehydratase